MVKKEITTKNDAPKGKLPPGDTARVSLNYKLWLLPEHFGSREQQARGGGTALAGIINFNNCQEVGMLLYNGGREDICHVVTSWYLLLSKDRDINPSLKKCISFWLLY